MVSITGDTNGGPASKCGLIALSQSGNLLVAGHAIPEEAGPAARGLHMPPTVVGMVAATSATKRLILSHRMNRTLGQEDKSLDHIRHAFSGPVDFAEDLDCFPLLDNRNQEN